MGSQNLKKKLCAVGAVVILILATFGLIGVGMVQAFAVDSAEGAEYHVGAGELPALELLRLMEQINVPVLFGEPEPFFVDGCSFYPVTVPQTVKEMYANIDNGVYPLQWDDRVVDLKTYLRDTFGENYFISYTQLRPEVMGCLDEQFAVLIEAVYLFTGTERDICLDDYTELLLRRLGTLSPEMQADIYTVYKHLLITRGLEGTLGRNGHADGLYFYAQTDEDWAEYPFPNYDSDTEYNDTMRNRSCGVMSFNMVAATYLHHEVDPTVLVDYAVDNGFRVEVSGVEDSFFHTAAEYYGIPDPTIYYADEGIDWDYIISKITEDNAMAIVHEYTGAFTSRQHYMVLADYEVIDGTGYFLVADPYVLRSRYSRWDQLLDTGRGNDGLIYATQAVLADTCSAVTLFEADRTEWDMTAKAAGSERLLIAEHPKEAA